ncbi:alpha/beta hydrolase [Psychrobacter sp.]|uniref:alpha/beta hydrolase n=1 Tax=Psychrobacter sp. TaxID=56811 RepID=UPI0025E2A28B|nr:alpha/beta hydrolase [Psychrobacter sp.]
MNFITDKYFYRIGIILFILCYISSAYAFDPTTTIDLWSPDYLAKQHKKPLPIEEKNSKGAISHVAMPRLLVYKPSKSNHKAILVISGGGYRREEQGKEAIPAAKWFTNRGYTVFNLIYRLPIDGWNSKLVPFADGQRALRIIHQKANDYDYKQIGVMGFSAGGHLAGILAVTEHNFYLPQDEIDSYSARPDFVALIYPVVSMESGGQRTQTYKQLIGDNHSLDLEKSLSIEQWVTRDTPPMFIAHAKDDPIASVDDSIALDEQLKKHHVKHTLVLFKEGGHGWGLGKAGTTTMAWPDMFQKWISTI